MTRKEAIKILSERYSSALFSERTALETLIPELKESGDENIRQGIVETIKQCTDILDPKIQKRMLAYLEKQKEQKSVESISRLTVQGKEVYKICPHCKSRMIRDDSKVYTSMPPQYGYNCPKCGAMEFDTVMYDNPEMEEQKSAEWNEEDESMIMFFENALEFIDENVWPINNITPSEGMNWLKSLPKRFNLQPKNEWNEEDKHRCGDAIYFLETAKKHYADTSEIELTIEWLKSLQPQARQEQKEPSDKGEISDGYHTFNELYYYRLLYNAAFFNLLPKEWVHKSKRHHDGEECFGGGWFIVMANLPTGQISNHYEIKDWDLFHIPEKETADKWDGHTPQEAAERLHKFLLEMPDCVCKNTVKIVPDDKIEEVGARFMRMRETKPANIGELLDRLTTVEQEFLWEHIEAVKKLDRKEMQSEQKPETKLTGWVARDREYNPYFGLGLVIFNGKPKRTGNCWSGEIAAQLPWELFPDIKCEDGPVEVEITIRKK